MDCKRLIRKALMLIALGPFGDLGFARATPNVVAWGANTAGQTNVPSDLTNAVAVAGGYSHSLALRSDGTVVAWGSNRFGETDIPPGLSNVVSIAARSSHSLALRGDGTVVAWGDQTNVPSGLTNVVAVATGFDHSMALRRDGTVVAWGTNFFGQVDVLPGLNNVVSISAGDAYSLALRAEGTIVTWGKYLDWEYWYPMYVPEGLSNVVAIASGDEHALALRADGTMAFWGDSHLGQGLNASGFTSAVAVAAGDAHSLALQPDGTVFAWGGNGVGQATVPAGLSNVVGIAAGYSHNLAVIGSGAPFSQAMLPDRSVAREVGTVTFYAPGAAGAWPLTYQWQLDGADLPGATNAWLFLTPEMLISAGLYSVTVSNSLGGVTTAPVRLSTVPAVFTEPPQDAATYLGGSSTFKLTAQASRPVTYQWRFDDTDLPGETNATLTVHDVTWKQQGPYSVEVSNRFGTVVSRDARLAVVNVAAWGSDYGGTTIDGGQTNVPASLSNAVAIAAGYAHSVALRADGTVLAWGANNGGQTNVPAGLSNVVSIAAGAYHNLALQGSGKVVAWGATPANVPEDLSNVVAIAAGGTHDLALRADGTVVAWGSDNVGQTDVPGGLSNIVAVACGYAHSLALSADGAITAWGQYQHFDPTQPIGWEWLPMEAPLVLGLPFLHIGSGYSHSLGLYADRTVLAWGEDRYAQTVVPWWLSGVVAVAGGEFDSLALRTDGLVVGWGNSSYGQTNVPPDLRNVAAIACGGEHNLALIGQGPPVLRVAVSNSVFTNGTFSVSLPTQSGHVYSLQYKQSLDAAAWTMLSLVSGNGKVRALTDPQASAKSRLYRVLQW